MWQGHLIVPGPETVLIPRILHKTLLAQYGLPYIDIFTQKYILPQQKRIFAKRPGTTKMEKSGTI